MQKILFTLFFYISSQFCFAQQEKPFTSLELFQQAEQYRIAFKNDSAEHILEKTIIKLEEQGELYTEFGLEVLQKRAFVQECRNKDRTAIRSIISVIEISLEYKKYGILAEAWISKARLHEKIQDFKNCLSSLNEAASLIRKNKIDSLKSRYFIRRSSYFRVSFTPNPDSSMHYAHKALNWSIKTRNREDAAVAHMLLGILYSKSSFVDSRYHLKETVKTFWKNGDKTGLTAMMNNLSRLYLHNGFIDSAFIYNDSTILISKNTPDKDDWFSAYKTRSEIYEKINKPDSVIYYLKKHYSMQQEYRENKMRVDVAKINSQYQSEKNKRTISEQAQKIKAEHDEIIFLVSVISFLILLGLILIYFYYRLRKSKRRTEKLSEIVHQINGDLSESLRENKTLLKEVHHRIKNNLQIVISMLEWYAIEEKSSIVTNNYKALVNRVNSIASIHELMYKKDELKDIGLINYIETLCNYIKKSMSDDSLSFDLQSQDLKFNMQTLIPLGILINELVTNSVKHGRINGKNLAITIKINPKEEGYLLHYKDNGKGLPTEEKLKNSKSMGWYLIRSMPRQLQGTVKMSNNGGAVFDIFFREQLN